jgi:hypothetical protein
MSADAFCSVEQAKQRLGIDDARLKELVRAAKLHLMKTGNMLQFRAEEVEQVWAEMQPAPDPSGVASPDDTATGGPAGQEEPIGLVEEPAGPEQTGERKIRSFGEGAITAGQGRVETSHLKRGLVQGATATRCRTFHCKLSEASVAYMNNQINEWTDSDPEIEIKFATCSIGIFEGKHAEQHLIMTVFY